MLRGRPLVFTRAYSIVYNIFVVTIWINRCRILVSLKLIGMLFVY